MLDSSPCEDFDMKLRPLAVLLLAATWLPACSQGVTTASLNDPSFGGIKAATLTIPAGWKFQGVMLTSACSQLPWPVYRAYSPDGLSEMRAMPVFGWRWSKYKGDRSGCLPLPGPMTAAEFLNKYIEMIPGGVHVVGAAPVSREFAAWKDQLVAAQQAGVAQAGGRLRIEYTGDAAALRIETINGTFVVEQRLRAGLFCEIQPDPGPLQGGNCWVRIEVLRAPKGKLDALIAQVDGQNLPRNVNDPVWEQKWVDRMHGQAREAMDAMNAMQQQASRMLLQQHQQFMATMQHNHDNFMQQQESTFRSSMNNANNAMNARTTAASDWVDYALDQQTVTGQGGTAKLSSAYSQTWSSTTGNQTQWFQTNDPNTNPNGILKGNWTQDTKVHGNGQSY
jgi:hypothetical protein